MIEKDLDLYTNTKTGNLSFFFFFKENKADWHYLTDTDIGQDRDLDDTNLLVRKVLVDVKRNLEDPSERDQKRKVNKRYIVYVEALCVII